jgi:hypothetical protein
MLLPERASLSKERAFREMERSFPSDGAERGAKLARRWHDRAA